METINNIPVEDYRKALEKLGLTCIRTQKGHEVWTRADLLRSVVFSAQFKDVKAGQIKSNCRALGIAPEELLKMMEGPIPPP